MLPVQKRYADLASVGDGDTVSDDATHNLSKQASAEERPRPPESAGSSCVGLVAEDLEEYDDASHNLGEQAQGAPETT